MKKFTLIIFILIFSIVGLSACTADKNPIEDEIEKPIEDPVEDEESELPEDNNGSNTWAATKEDTIQIEGSKEPITLNYFEGENFITYIPEDMVGEPYEIEEGDAYRFYTNYQGNKNNEVYLQILFYPENLAEKPDILGDAVDVVEENNRYHDWALEEYTSKNGGLYGILGQHENQYFSIILNYLPEFSEGFVPRANKIIENIYFTDTNEYLVEEAQ
jgi:hypothetical protein